MQWLHGPYKAARPAPALRPVRPDDARALAALIEGLPTADRYLRFHGAVNGLGEDALRGWTAPDRARAFALVATVTQGGRETLVADARYALDAAGDAAEVGLLVAPAWRRHGVGSRCLGALRLAAHRSGVRWLYGSVLADNLPMLALLKRNGFTLARSRGRRGVVIAETRVDTPASAPGRRPVTAPLAAALRPFGLGAAA